MHLKQKNIFSKEQLVDQIRQGVPSLYHSSKTSTVIPYGQLEELWRGEEVYLVNMGSLPSKFELIEEDLHFEGAVSFKDARDFLRSKGRDLAVAPTEELALLYGGVSTSATGEYSFAYGPLRNQVKDLTYYNSKGECLNLHSDQLLADTELFSTMEAKRILKNYQQEYSVYRQFKNAPFPRFEFSTDLLVGTEGQLGVVVGGVLKTVIRSRTQSFFIKIPCWIKDFSAHLEIFEKIQSYRGKILICEFIDAESFAMANLKTDFGFDGQNDAIFIEILDQYVEEIFDNLFSNLTNVSPEQIFQLEMSQFDFIRKDVPRKIWELNLKNGVTKKGTDVQVPPQHLENLLLSYRKAHQLGVPCVLFGHFGDAHLHFNFLPSPDQILICDQFLQKFYSQVEVWKGSPFAEHGIGILKQKYIALFYRSPQREMFRYLKSKMDPEKNFFPQGFMSL